MNKPDHETTTLIAQLAGALLSINLNSPKSFFTGLSVFFSGLCMSYFFTPVVMKMPILAEWGIKSDHKAEHAVGFSLGLLAMFFVRWFIKKFLGQDLNNNNNESGND